MPLLQTGQVFKILAPQKVIPKPTYGNDRVDNKALTVDSYANGESFFVELAKALWVVTGTEMSGGGTRHSPYDVYPDGHGVNAVRVEDDGEPTGQSIFFRQSGCFNNMLEEGEVEVVGTVKGTRYNLALMV